MRKLSKRLSDSEASLIGQPIKKATPHGHAKYRVSRDEWSRIEEGRNHGLIEAFDRRGVDPSNSPDLWLKGKDESIRVKNPFYVQPEEKTYGDLEQMALDSIDNISKRLINKVAITPNKVNTEYLFDVLVFTDTHIGMDPNSTGYSLYGGVWDKKELMSRMRTVVRETISEKKANKLIIFDLGDFMDGWDAQTVRKGHSLPQNMSNEAAFDAGLRFKVELIDSLVDHYFEIDIINICDDNHAGSFGYVVNSAFKSVIENRYDNVVVTNQRKFIDYYIYGKKVFVATHGKDGSNLKFGFKPKLDPVQIEKIENYLYENRLVDPAYDIYFLKGDSHQDLFDNGTAQKFKYWNFPALSPSSNWIQTNYKKGVSGFYNINFKKDKFNLNPYYFPWQ